MDYPYSFNGRAGSWLLMLHFHLVRLLRLYPYINYGYRVTMKGSLAFKLRASAHARLLPPARPTMTPLLPATTVASRSDSPTHGQPHPASTIQSSFRSTLSSLQTAARCIFRGAPSTQEWTAQRHSLHATLSAFCLSLQVSWSTSWDIKADITRLWRKYRKTSFLLIQIPVSCFVPHALQFSSFRDRSSRSASSLLSDWTRVRGLVDGGSC